MTRNPFWSSPTYRVIQAMRASGNRPGIIAQWKSLVELWADENRLLPETEPVRAWLPHWHARPFYSGAELAPLFPALAVSLGITARLAPTMSPARMMMHLDYGGLPRLEQFDLSTHYRHPVTGIVHRFYIVERIHHWSRRPMSQAEFEDIWHGHA